MDETLTKLQLRVAEPGRVAVAATLISLTVALAGCGTSHPIRPQSPLHAGATRIVAVAPTGFRNRRHAATNRSTVRKELPPAKHHGPIHLTAHSLRVPINRLHQHRAPITPTSQSGNGAVTVTGVIP
jgi:hypothetical protein